MKPYKLSKVQRLILSNQFRILASLESGAASSEQYAHQADIVENGYEVLYPEVFERISKRMSYERGREILDILNMFRIINAGSEKAGIDSIIFKGFDNHTETSEYLFIEFLISIGKYQELKNLDLHADQPKLPQYRTMLKLCEELKIKREKDVDAKVLEKLRKFL